MRLRQDLRIASFQDRMNPTQLTDPLLRYEDRSSEVEYIDPLLSSLSPILRIP